MNRKILWAVLVVGLVLIAAPFAIGLPAKAAAGERMMDDFAPLMQPQNVQTTADYYYDVFVPLGKVAPMISDTTMQRLNGYMGQMAPVLKQNPEMAQDFTGLFGVMAANTVVFGRVNAGLDHYKPLVDTMQGNVGDYDSVSSLPDFRLFTWFFLVPGLLLVLLAGWGLFGDKVVHAFGPRPAHVS